MSSGYESAAAEAARREALRKQLIQDVKNMKDKLKAQSEEKHENNIVTNIGSGMVMSVFAQDNMETGMNARATVLAQTLDGDPNAGHDQDKELDFSCLLIAKQRKPTRLEMELDALVSRIDERPVVTEKDEKDRIRLIQELSRVLDDPNMDIEDKIRFVKMRVLSFLEDSAKLTAQECARIEDQYLEYCALCDLMEIKPSTKVPYRVENEIKKLHEALEKRRVNEFIMDVIEESLVEMGCKVKDEAVLDHTVGQMYSVGDDDLCDVFVAHDGSGIMFEPVGTSREGSLEQQRKVEEQANKICSMYSKLEEIALEKGVILSRVYADPADIKTMCVQSDISERRESKSKRKTKAKELKQRSIGSED